MALTMTPEQLERYRATRRRRAAEESERRHVRTEAAREMANQAAALLRAEFGATDVVLFGSLAEDDQFGMRSDIDLAVRGIEGSGLYAALGRLLTLSAGFEFDLVDLDMCPRSLGEAIAARGVTL
jgi:predicted nucleotidyltransferase